MATVEIDATRIPILILRPVGDPSMEEHQKQLVYLEALLKGCPFTLILLFDFNQAALPSSEAGLLSVQWIISNHILLQQKVAAMVFVHASLRMKRAMASLRERLPVKHLATESLEEGIDWACEQAKRMGVYED